MHRGQVRAGGARAEAETPGLIGERFDVARQRVVALIAMQVDHQPALGRDLAQSLHRSRAVGHRALEMRDAADYVDAEVERALQVRRGGRRAEIAVLRKGDELQVEIGRDLLLHLEQRFDRQQPVVADVDVRAHRQQTLGDGEVAIAQRAFGDRLVGQQRLQLAPQRDAFEQGARLVEPRQAERQRRVHVEMAVDERRRDQPPLRLDDDARLGGDCGLDRDDAAVARGDVDSAAAVGQVRAADDEVEGHLAPLMSAPAAQLCKPGASWPVRATYSE